MDNPSLLLLQWPFLSTKALEEVVKEKINEFDEIKINKIPIYYNALYKD